MDDSTRITSQTRGKSAFFKHGDEKQVRQTLALLLKFSAVIEIRVLKATTGTSSNYRRPYYGYFDDVDKAIKALASITDAEGFYTTFNSIDPDLLARCCNRLAAADKECSTTDRNVCRRRGLLIDVDSQRTHGISATIEEKEHALCTARSICEYLRERGWCDPIKADSGNGFHLLYPIDEPPNDNNLIKNVLNVLAEKFDTGEAKVDRSVHNSSRITKLYGTFARKGDDTESRPHRKSQLLIVPDPLGTVTHEQLEAVANEVKLGLAAEPTFKNNTSRSAFDLGEWIRESGLEIVDEGPYSNANGAEYRWKLKTCPFCGESDKSAVIMRMSGGRAAFKCHHNRCAGKGWSDLREKIEPGYKSRKPQASKPSDEESDPTNKLPEVVMPGGERTISATAAELGSLLALERSHFLRGGVPTRFADGLLRPVAPAELASDFEHVARLVRIKEGEDGVETTPCNCSESNAKLILNSQVFKDALPRLNTITKCPVLIERNGELTTISGYDRESGIFAQGQTPSEISLLEAPALLHKITDSFLFPTPSDRSRALAALITPALVMGGLLPGRAPGDVGEADQSQSGKGYRNKLTAAIYNDVPVTITQRTGGVGGLEESFDGALIAGANFIALDNIRGQVNSPRVESFMTEDVYQARCPYTPLTKIDPRRTIVMLTSNQANLTKDLANRASCVRILKLPPSHQFPEYAEGDLLEHVRANYADYLGAVFAIILEWHRRGKPRTRESRHDFRRWAQILDWIVQNLLGAAPLLDGHRETQQRMTNPVMNWCRDVVLAVKHAQRTGEWLTASDILDVIDGEPDVEIPGLKAEASLEDNTVRTGVLRQIGRRLKQLFRDSADVQIDSLRIERENYRDEEYRERHRYLVVNLGANGDPIDEPCGTAESDGPAAPITGLAPLPIDDPLDAPPDDPIDKPRDPIEPIDGLGKRVSESDYYEFGAISEPSMGSVGSRGGDAEAPWSCGHCGHTKYVDIPVHDGQSVCRDCARCQRFDSFVRWQSGEECVADIPA